MAFCCNPGRLTDDKGFVFINEPDMGEMNHGLVNVYFAMGRTENVD
jgi:hypothetical protein